jgi:coproporphyrinogen III oxidase
MQRTLFRCLKIGLFSSSFVLGYLPPTTYVHASSRSKTSALSTASKSVENKNTKQSSGILFDEFVDFLQQKQNEIIAEIESIENGSKFSRDGWGIFAQEDGCIDTSLKSGGITRVIQGGGIIEKGACSLTVIKEGVLSADRAATIRARQSEDVVVAGDVYSAAALSLVFHTRSPLVPTFRSDVRIFMVHTGQGKFLAWFGGGADLTPYYLLEDDIRAFHNIYRDLCQELLPNHAEFTYETMKKDCDDYFYLPARNEHRGTGGIFFDDMMASETTLAFVKCVADTWMPSWLPIVKARGQEKYSEQQKQWQLLRRGRYLEFNLLYDRGVKFGLANSNPRVEGVMVSAPPVIAFEYNHQITPNSPEAKLTEVLKNPREWASSDDSTSS